MIMLELLEQLKDFHYEQYVHSKNVEVLCEQMAIRLNLNEKQIEDLKYIGLYHDIGKLRIPIEILGKEGSLTEYEWTIIRLHSLYSTSLLDSLDREVKDAVLFHHENLDGSGYFKMRDEQLSLYQRIIHVCDVYEALTAKRCYKEPWTKEEALRYMNDNIGKMFDCNIVKLLEDIVS